MPHAAVNGVQLYYEERGRGTPILGIHGAGSSALFWEDAAAKLAELGRAIVYDRRGCTRSERPDPYDVTSVQAHADDALALMHALDAAPAILVGRSYGGTVALDLAIRHPDAVLGIALLEAGPTGLSAEYDAWFEKLGQDLEATVRAWRDFDAVGETVLRAVFGDWEGLPEAFREVFAANGQSLLAEIRGAESTDIGRLGEISVPALVVTAEDSPAEFQLVSEAVAGALPNARSVRVGGGHAIDPAGPDVFAFVADLVRA